MHKYVAFQAPYVYDNFLCGIKCTIDVRCVFRENVPAGCRCTKAQTAFSPAKTVLSLTNTRLIASYSTTSTQRSHDPMILNTRIGDSHSNFPEWVRHAKLVSRERQQAEGSCVTSGKIPCHGGAAMQIQWESPTSMGGKLQGTKCVMVVISTTEADSMRVHGDCNFDLALWYARIFSPY